MPAVDTSGTAQRPQGAAPTSATTPPAGDTTPETKQVPIQDLESKFGWKPDSWQHQLLQSADGSGDKDGSVSASELDGYMKNPKDLKFVNSERLQEIRGDLGTSTTPQAVSSFERGWERNLAGRRTGWATGTGSSARRNSTPSSRR